MLSFPLDIKMKAYSAKKLLATIWTIRKIKFGLKATQMKAGQGNKAHVELGDIYLCLYQAVPEAGILPKDFSVTQAMRFPLFFKLI